MWLLTPIGFFSIVCKPEDVSTGTLTVRARVKADLENLRAHLLPELGEIRKSPHNDYRYRAQAPRGAVAQAMARSIEQLGYSNFKSEVGRKQGHERAGVYHDVWDVLYNLQDNPLHERKVSPA